MQAWHQKNLLTPGFPFHLILSSDLEFPPHWHDEMELVYIQEGEIRVGLNNEIYSMKPDDMLLVGSGDVHYFLNHATQSNCRMVILQFELSLFDALSTTIASRRFCQPFIPAEGNTSYEVHSLLKRVLLDMVSEYVNQDEGYLLAMKARIYDLLVLLLRRIPQETYSDFQRRRQLIRLDRLEQVFRYVDANYAADICLKDAADIANFSVYHFTRFFKEATGMTFGRYLNNVRLRRAGQHLLSTGDPITEVAFRVGFNSIKTFNRLFKDQMGCAPSHYRRGRVDSSTLD